MLISKTIQQLHLSISKSLDIKKPLIIEGRVHFENVINNYLVSYTTSLSRLEKEIASRYNLDLLGNSFPAFSMSAYISCLLTYLHKDDGNPEYEGRDPCHQDGLPGLANSAQILGLQRVHDGVVPVRK